MKRIWFLLTALVCVMLACPAWAQDIPSSDIATPRTGVAVCAPSKDATVPMYREADENSAVLMNYFSGTRANVLNILENGMVEVRTGEGRVTLTGYMRADDLRYGANALRAISWAQATIEFKKDAPVYAACDENSETLKLFYKDEQVTVSGISDEWLQIEPAEYDGDIVSRGYMRNVYTENEYAGGFIRRSYASLGSAEQVERWIYLPTEDELTHEQAYERALELLMTTAEGQAHMKARLSREHRTREGMEKLNADIRLSEYDNGKNYGICWQITLENIENIDENVVVLMTPQGELIEFTHGNG